jgi:UV DNA damage repair endonuclease
MPASVALKWFKAEPDSVAARAVLLRDMLTAPELAIAEVLNAGWKAVRLGEGAPLITADTRLAMKAAGTPWAGRVELLTAPGPQARAATPAASARSSGPSERGVPPGRLPPVMTAETAIPRIGFCCKWLPPDGDPMAARAMNQTGATVAGLGRRERSEAMGRLLEVVRHNLEALARQLHWLAARPPGERMMRITSGLLPAYTHPTTRWIYLEPTMRALVEEGLGQCGAIAGAHAIRLGMHPGQFCVLATQSETALRNSIEELEYHTDVMRWLGLAGGWHPQGAHINVHGGARAAGVATFRSSLRRLSLEARGLLTVENDETSFGLDDLLPLADELPLVLDVYHHWIWTAGEYIEPDDPRIATVAASWRGVRPVAHFSEPREDLLPGHSPSERPDFEGLVAAGIRPRDLRAHSDRLWNRALNDWAIRHLAWADLEIEAKGKNLAVADLAERIAGRAVA